MLSQFSLNTALIPVRNTGVVPKVLMREDDAPDDNSATLDETAVTERDYVRNRLREELKREPSEDEVDDWLRQQTEGF
ncbi:MAG: hypothetical protein QOJ64_4194 [Acidobacteriota bacterium]|nr:hypothetical protein [Acidobacteriota bacterium]